MYGMVQDVRIPYQEKCMFGFVTFAYQKTVKLILAKGNPHYICDARATKVVFARLQALEPNLAPNIIGMLLTKDNNEMDMIRLACGPDNLLQSIIAKVRTDLTNKPSPPMASWGFPSDIGEEASFSVDKVGCDGGEEFSSKEYDWRLPIGGNHHRSFLSSTVDTLGWKPCLYSQSGVTTHLGSDDMQEYSSRPPQIDQRPRILYRDIASHEASFRMKQDEQQHATELQRCCLMRLPLLNLQDWGHHLSSPMGSHDWGHHLSSPMGSHVLLGQVDNKYNINENDNPTHLEDVTFRDNKLKNEFAMREIASTAISTAAKRTVISTEEGKREYGPKAATPNDACGFLESGMEYNLPHSPFSSPTKASNVAATAHTSNISSSSSPHKVASSLFPPTCTLELPPTTHASFKRQDSPLAEE
uniref:AtC3H46-like PABC-like domain-containing protein n=1 Tax=Oryza rufipogon TaxID=4529 RepID=A0A0E0RD37_ORYRU